MRWEQPELYDCNVDGHNFEQVEIIRRGYEGHLQWECTECEDIWDGESE